MLQVTDLDVFYGQVQVLRGVSLEVGANEALAVLGANGAGKSTLMKTLAGWLQPRRGRVLFQGRDVTRLAPWERAAIGIALVPEGGRVFRDLNVLDNLRLGAYLQPDEVMPRRLEEVFALFPILAERKGQLAKTLSGGEQQMLAIGRALMSRPRLLLVDEISMGLMPVLVKQVFGVLNELRQTGVSILLAEQNAYEALHVVDRACVLENGRIILEGTPEDLRENPRVKAAYLGG
ncbi:MAG: ABC transporter ATP-binding protein [Anaerolineae bacterium]